MNKKILVLFILCVISSTSNAEVLPQGTSFDGRIQNVNYNPDDVVTIKVKEGVSTLIQLEKDETLMDPDQKTGMGLGDPLAWEVSVRGNNIFLRPKAEQPDTNVNMVTNKRTYTLFLQTVKKGASPSWFVRFNYPAQNPSVFINKPILPCMNTGHTNWNYMKQGDNAIAPVSVWDDGQFTCMRFSSSTDLPVVFRLLPDGKEALVNSHMEDDVMVIHETSKEFRVRLGSLVLGLKSDTIKPAGYNYKGTTTGQVREIVK